MPRTIFKYTLSGRPRETVYMPEGAQVLTVQVQKDDPQLWALVDPDAPLRTRMFHTYGTGHQIEADNLSYVGTYQIDSGTLVLHVFEEI